jgi:hypothetical protein
MSDDRAVTADQITVEIGHRPTGPSLIRIRAWKDDMALRIIDADLTRDELFSLAAQIAAGACAPPPKPPVERARINRRK